MARQAGPGLQTCDRQVLVGNFVVITEKRQTFGPLWIFFEFVANAARV